MRRRSPAYELLVTEFAVVLVCMMFNADNGLRHVGERLWHAIMPAAEQPAGQSTHFKLSEYRNSAV